MLPLSAAPNQQPLTDAVAFCNFPRPTAARCVSRVATFFPPRIWASAAALRQIEDRGVGNPMAREAFSAPHAPPTLGLD